MTIFWLLAFVLFGLVAIESGSWMPLAAVGVVWLVAQPFIRPQAAKMRAGGLDPDAPSIFAILMWGGLGLLIFTVLMTWRG